MTIEQEQRTKLVNMINNHISSDVDMTINSVDLVSELVFALCCSKETHDIAVKQMEEVVKMNNSERHRWDNV